MKRTKNRKTFFQGTGTPPLSPAPGLPRAWNPSAPAAGGVVNLATGNLSIMQHVVGWNGLGEGVSLELTYNSEGNSSGSFGNHWLSSYDWSVAGASPVTIHRPDGSLDVYTLSNGNYIAPPGVNMSLVKNANSTFSLTTKDGTTYNFNSAGKLASISDRNSNQTSLTYSSGLLSTVQDLSGRTLTIGYNSGGLANQATDCIGRIWTFQYDSSNNLISVTLPALNGSTFKNQYAYSMPGTLTPATDPAGNASSYSYGTNGTISSWTNALGDQSSFSFAPVLQSGTHTTTSTNTTTTGKYPVGTVSVATVSDSLGFSSSNCIDSLGRKLADVDAFGNQTRLTWDSNYDILTKTLPDGAKSTWTYDLVGNDLTSTNGINQTTTMKYDQLNDLTSVALPCGCTSTWTFDSKGNPTGYTSGTGVSITYQVASTGRVIKSTDALGYSSTLAYDQFGNMVTCTDALGQATTYSFGNSGLTNTSINRPGDPPITFAYDNWLQETSQTSNGQSETKTYDADERMLTDVSPEVGSKSFQYDAIGDKTRSTTTVGTANYSYNIAGMMTNGTDASGTAYANTYDQAGRVTQVSGPGNSTTYSYDADSRAITENDSLGLNETFAYNAANQMIQEKVTNSSNGVVFRNYTCTYGQNEMLSGVSDSVSGSVTSIGYNADEQEVSESRTGLAPYSETMGYDSRAYLSSYGIVSNGTSMMNASMFHNQDGELTSLSDSTGTSDLAGNYTWNADGTLASYPGKNITRVCSYDNWGRLTGLAENNGTVTTPTFSYQYDNDGNLQARAAMSANTGNWYDRSLHHGAVALGSFSSDSTQQKWTAQVSSASFHTGYSSGTSSTIYSPAGNEVLTVNNGVVTNAIEADCQFNTIFAGTVGPSDFYQAWGTTNDEHGNMKTFVARTGMCSAIVPKGLDGDYGTLISCMAKASHSADPTAAAQECISKFGGDLSAEACKYLGCLIASTLADYNHYGHDPCTYKPKDVSSCHACCYETWFCADFECIRKPKTLCQAYAKRDLENCMSDCDVKN